MTKVIRISLSIICVALFAIVDKSYPQTTWDAIRTIAGNGTSGFSGDGGPAVDAKIYYPYNVAVDAGGNIYIADTYNHRIRKIDTSGNISTIAGTGTGYYNGDNILATSAQLNGPADVEVDSDGNIYIADTKNYRIRKINTSGYISTVAGNGSYGFSGDGNLAILAKLSDPTGIDIDSDGNIYIADMLNHRIRKVDVSSGNIYTIAGGGTVYYEDGILATNAGLYQPSDVEIDNTGNIYIADSKTHRIRKIATDEKIYTVAGTRYSGFEGDNGPATSARINNPLGITLDSSGNLYISDTGNQRIRKVGTDNIITTIAGDGATGFGGDYGNPLYASFNSPRGIVIKNNSELILADSYNNRIRKIFAAPGVPPVLDFVGSQNVDEDGTLDVNISASDSDGDSIILSSSNLPSFVSFVDYGNGTGLLTITPGSDDIGVHEGIVITANDGYFSDADTISITVNNVLPPDAPQNVMVYAGINEVNLSWSPNNEKYILQYNIYRSIYNGFNPTPLDSIGGVLSPDTTFVDSAISLNTTYYYKISAVDSSNLESDFSMQVLRIITKFPHPTDP